VSQVTLARNRKKLGRSGGFLSRPCGQHGSARRIRPHASIGYKPPAPEVFVPRIRRVAGCATPTGSAGHAGGGFGFFIF
jgi:hypothetical protein